MFIFPLLSFNFQLKRFAIIWRRNSLRHTRGTHRVGSILYPIVRSSVRPDCLYDQCLHVKLYNYVFTLGRRVVGRSGGRIAFNERRFVRDVIDVTSARRHDRPERNTMKHYVTFTNTEFAATSSASRSSAASSSLAMDGHVSGVSSLHASVDPTRTEVSTLTVAALSVAVTSYVFTKEL